MQHMMEVKIFKILAGDDVDPCVPFLIEWLHRVELFLLDSRQRWKIFFNEFHTKKREDHIFPGVFFRMLYSSSRALKS